MDEFLLFAFYVLLPLVREPHAAPLAARTTAYKWSRNMEFRIVSGAIEWALIAIR